MYINVKNLFSLKNPLSLPLLLVLRHATKKDVSEQIAMLIDDLALEELINDGFVKSIKGTKDSNELQKLRLDKKGTAFLNSLQDPEVEEQDVLMFNWLKGVYLNEGKKVGNGKNTQRLIAAFREHSGIEKNHLAFLCNTFLKDEDNMQWNNVLEYAFFKPKNVFSVRFVLEDSRLYKYFKNREQYFTEKFKTIKNG